MKKDIYKEINIIKDDHIKSNKLYEFIEENNIPRSFNSNGTFINLTVIDSKYIHLLSDFLFLLISLNSLLISIISLSKS